jgi:predicted transcriptional regulator
MRSLERANMLRVIIILRNGPMSLTEVYGCIRAPGVGRERLRVLQEMNVVHLTKDGKVTLAQLTPVGKEVAERLSEIGRSIGRLNRY